MPTLPVEPPASEREAREGMVEALKRLCESAKANAAEPLLQLDGLLPLRDFLLDAPIGASEFESERQRLRSGKPRWNSLLQHRELQQLQEVCPGAKELIAWRKACVGYFLAE